MARKQEAFIFDSKEINTILMEHLLAEGDVPEGCYDVKTRISAVRGETGYELTLFCERTDSDE